MRGAIFGSLRRSTGVLSTFSTVVALEGLSEPQDVWNRLPKFVLL